MADADVKLQPLDQAEQIDTSHCKACGSTLRVLRHDKMSGDDGACEIAQYECAHCGMVAEIIRKDLIP